MGEKIKKITTETVIPIGFAILIVSAVVGGAFWIGGLAQAVDEIVDKDSPSRAEYNLMCQNISDIKKGVDNLNNHFINKGVDK